MNILILGDIMGPSGREAIIKKLPYLIKKKKIDFVIVNGENAADPGVGITRENTEDFFQAGADVITTGNHVWDQKETMEFINLEKRLLRPENLIKGSPGTGIGIFNSRNNKKVAVINLMGNIFMKKCEDVFETAKNFIQKVKLKLLICTGKLLVKKWLWDIFLMERLPCLLEPTHMFQLQIIEY